jgi:uncharacterized Zn finger protein (UPF0148 family)
MKVCEVCGVEIATRDGENRCATCDAKVRKSAKRRKARRERDAIMRSLGLTKVKGALGGTYWE